LRFYIDKKVTKDVPIVLKFKGMLNQKISFYKDIELDPKRVLVTGPEKLLNNIDYLESEEIDLSKLKKSQSLKVKLRSSDEFIEYKNSIITVKFYIEKRLRKSLRMFQFFLSTGIEI